MRRSDLTAARTGGHPPAVIQGLLVVDKPVGMTSHDVVERVRRIFRMRQVGHTGTLDPVASGVLVLMLGSATRIAQYLQEDDKEYNLILRLGIETDTQDRTGTVLAETDPSGVTRQAVSEALGRYRGSFQQVPPAYSAVKVQGQPLYKLARKGQPAVAKPRTVTISKLELTSWDPPRAGLAVTCSKGTYMRTLCHDLGQDLGVGGSMESLVRTRSGSFRLEEAVRLEELRRSARPLEYLKPAVAGLSFPAVTPEAARLQELVQGREIDYDGPTGPGLVSVVHDGMLVAVAQVKLRDGKPVIGPKRLLEPELKELFKQ